jgi:hypothetical protein
VVHLSAPPAPRPFVTDVLETRRALPSPPFHRPPRPRAQQPGSPSGSSSLSTPTRRQALPGHPDLARRNRSRSASFVDFGALLPLRVRSNRHGYLTATAGRDSPGCSAPPELHHEHLESSDPPRPLDLNTTRPPAVGRATTTGTSQPPQPGEASPHTEVHASTRSAASSPLRDWPAPPRGDASTPSASGERARTRPPRPTERQSM